MHPLLQSDVIFFDLDGLLVNTEYLHFAAYQAMLAKRDLDLPYDFYEFAAIAHKSDTGLQKAIYASFPQLKEQWTSLYADKQEIYLSLLKNQHLKLMPGVEEVLLVIQKAHIPHSVVTNSTEQQVKLIQDQLPFLKSIETWITREDYKNPKPSPDGYLVAIERLGGRKKTMVGFEDSLRGIHALEKAQIEPVLICHPSHPQLHELKSDSLYFESFYDLLAFHH